MWSEHCGLQLWRKAVPSVVNRTFHGVFVSDAAWDELVGDYKIAMACGHSQSN